MILPLKHTGNRIGPSYKSYVISSRGSLTFQQHSMSAVQYGVSETTSNLQTICTLGRWNLYQRTLVRNSPSGTITFHVSYFTSSRGSSMAWSTWARGLASCAVRLWARVKERRKHILNLNSSHSARLLILPTRWCSLNTELLNIQPQLLSHRLCALLSWFMDSPIPE